MCGGGGGIFLNKTKFFYGKTTHLEILRTATPPEQYVWLDQNLLGGIMAIPLLHGDSDLLKLLGSYTMVAISRLFKQHLLPDHMSICPQPFFSFNWSLWPIEWKIGIMTNWMKNWLGELNEKLAGGHSDKLNEKLAGGIMTNWMKNWLGALWPIRWKIIWGHYDNIEIHNS